MKAELAQVLRPLEVNEAMVFAVVHLDVLSQEERCALFNLYCNHCGARQPWHPTRKGLAGMSEQGCQCWNDE
jgi:hypothetical protein